MAGTNQVIVSPRDRVMAIAKGGARNFFAAALKPYNRDVDNYIASLNLLLMQSPDLLDCRPESLIDAARQCAELGLTLNKTTGHGYIVKFKDAATFIPGYKGLIALAMRSGLVDLIEARVVYQGDTFNVTYGTDAKIEHTETMSEDRGANAGEWSHVYAIATLKNGRKLFEVMSKAQVLRVKSKSRSQSGPWSSDFDRMALKTVIRRLMNLLDLDASPMLVRALDHDEAIERGELVVTDAVVTTPQTRSAAVADALGAEPESTPDQEQAAMIEAESKRQDAEFMGAKR